MANKDEDDKRRYTLNEARLFLLADQSKLLYTQVQETIEAIRQEREGDGHGTDKPEG